jgi:hypothetical protein
VGSQFENAIEYQGSSLEETITPVPAVVLYDVVGFDFHPEIEANQGNTTEPPSMFVNDKPK